MDLRSSSELDHRDPVPFLPVARRMGRHFLSWTPSALRHMPAGRTRLPTANPFAAAYHVRGLVTSFAVSTAQPPDASSAPEHPWASPFKVFPSSRSVPLSGPVPSWRYRLPRIIPEVDANNLAAFKAFFPRRVRAVAETRGFRPSIPSWGSPLQSFALVRPGARFDRGASPLALGTA